MGGCAWQGALCDQSLGVKRVETESAECRDVQVEVWVGLGGPGWGRKGRRETLGAGLERVLTIRINNWGSILEGKAAAQSRPPSPGLL